LKGHFPHGIFRNELAQRWINADYGIYERRVTVTLNPSVAERAE